MKHFSPPAAFILVCLFVWLVFDNLALGLIGGLLASGAAAKASRG